MSERTVTDCDRCGAQNIQGTRFSLCTDRVADAAGGMDDIYIVFDLCSKCTAFLLKQHLGTLDMQESSLWIKRQVPKVKRQLTVIGPEAA